MNALLSLTRANLKSFVRDRAALFWTIAFPVIFIFLFGTLFSGGGSADYKIGWVDLDSSAASEQLHQAFDGVPVLTITPTDEAAGLASARDGSLDAVIVVPAGFGTAVSAATGAASPGQAAVTLYADPSDTSTTGTINQIVAAVLTGMNQELSGRPPVLTLKTASIQGTATLNGASYFVPSILAMAIMQLGLFGTAQPIVQLRDQGILRRLGATPLPRGVWLLSQVAMRMSVALLQAAIIVMLGMVAFQVPMLGSWLVLVGFVLLGGLMFISLGYVIAAFSKNQESASGISSILSFPLMFLSGLFFPVDFMPAFLKPVVAIVPLTYLADALRQIMVGSNPLHPLMLDAAILGGWFLVCLVISVRFFKWE